MECIPEWFALPGEKLNFIHVRRWPSMKLSHAAETIKEVEQILNEERYDSGMTKMFERWFLQLSDHKLWPKIKERGIESQNAEYWGSTKTGAKAARHFCGWTIKIYDLHKQHLQERCKSCRHDIEITEINTYISKLQIVKSAVLPHLTANWCQMPES